MRTIRINNVTIGPDAPLAVIAGPCAAESLDLCMHVATTMRDQCARLGLGYIFKASFDKANRSSIDSYRGPGIDQALQWFAAVKRELNVPVTTDIHEPAQAAAVADVVDLIQVPAFLCRQTDLLVASANTGRPVNVKKGQFMSPAQMQPVITKLTESGADASGVMLTERGTFFGYGRLVSDFVGTADMLEMGWPVCFDVTHSTQQPGASSAGDLPVSGGRPEMAIMLARCAVVAGVQALFIETHLDPANARSDAQSMLTLEQAVDVLVQVVKLRDAMS